MTVDFERLGVDCLLVNSVNEFFAEYSELSENARYTLTKFSGSTGDALVLKTGEIYLFVDGRYHTQAELEAGKEIILVKLLNSQNQDDEIVKHIPAGYILGIAADKNTPKRVERFRGENIKIKLLDLDPINFYTEINKNKIEFLPSNLTGKTFEEKIQNLPKPFFISNLEEVSYLINARDFSADYKSKIQGKLLITEYENVLFTDMEAADKSVKNLAFMPLAKTREILRMIEYPVYVDASQVSAADYAAITIPNDISSPVKEMKAVKTFEEIESYKNAFKAADKALADTREFIMAVNETSEYEIAEVLEDNFKKYGARCLSFKTIAAKDKNSALPHYSKCSKDEIVKTGSLILIDCGAYFENGLATDITRVFVKGAPQAEHQRIYTAVLRMFLHAYNTPATENITGYEIDRNARDLIKYNPIEGYTFGHGLGHGIGINVHEAPPNLSTNDIAKHIITDWMCFTIEPGLYNPQTFGVRLENSCYMDKGQIKSFTNMPYEKNLIDFSMLNNQEQAWLEEFELI